MVADNKISIEWERQRHLADLSWIRDNLLVFLLSGRMLHEDMDRDAIVVDNTEPPVVDLDYRFGYFTREQAEETEDEDTNSLARDFDPTQRLVYILLKPENQCRTASPHG